MVIEAAMSPTSVISSDCEQIDADDYMNRMWEKLGVVLLSSAGGLDQSAQQTNSHSNIENQDVH